MTREDFIAQLRQGPPEAARAGIISESHFSDGLAAGRNDADVLGEPNWPARQQRADAGFKRCWRELAGAMQAILQESSDDA